MKSVNKLATLVCLLIPTTVFALDIGNTKVHSELYQALNAEVQLNNTTGIPAKELHVAPAPASAYALRGITADPAVNEMNLNVANVDGKPVLKVTSSTPITTPIVDFLVQLQWPKGQTIERVTLLPQLPGQGDEIAMAKTSLFDNIEENFNQDISTIETGAKTVWQSAIEKIMAFTRIKLS